ncbi:MAG: alkyl hydroperoxide reductase [Chloroflexi bacterium]|nr:alkyl hydroperoxide reductase [Chloroflexota bacterium]
MHIFPQLRKLEQKYANELAVVGIHSAKFPNEKGAQNLLNAVQRYELKHPVANDVDFQVWQEYACRAWPTLIFVDPQGKVIGKHEGEIDYETFDNLLGRMVAEFDAGGLLDHTAVHFLPEQEPESILAFPGKVLADGPGDRLFISDSNHNRILVTTLDGELKQVIGSGEAGMEDGPFASASLDHPQGMALAGDALYVADTENHAIRKVDLTEQMVWTVAGTGGQGQPQTGRGPGRSTGLNSPWDLVVHQGSLYIAMAGCHQLWSMNLSDGTVGPHAGSGQESLTDGPLSTATLAQPSGITTDGDRLFFADSETSSVRSADLAPSGRVSTIVGLDLFVFGDVDGSDQQVRLQHPLGIAWFDGVLYLADTYNHKIKRVFPATRSVLTLLGIGEPGHQDGPGASSMFSEPSGLSIANGKLYIADTNNHAIRVADLAANQVSTLELDGL